MMQDGEQLNHQLPEQYCYTITELFYAVCFSLHKEDIKSSSYGV